MKTRSRLPKRHRFIVLIATSIHLSLRAASRADVSARRAAGHDS